MPSASEIRQQFIDFFVKKCGHTFVPSSPCVPHDDPTLMFANAGMNQFKPIFLGQQEPDVDKWPGVIPGMPTRAANSQKCIRAGGKHNDLDDVGHDTYHHTFFEMLGNWSFGDYFKKEAIEWAWELLTKVWGIDGSRLHATYFEGDSAEGLDPDYEARDLWLKILPPERVHPGNKKDNFWEMGDTGPCGPCSEIHIDLTPDKTGAPLVNAGVPEVIEIWNLVFIQFNRANDGKLSPLPAKHVDTGMGFERVSAVLQGMQAGKLGKFSNYDTDIFTEIFDAIREVTGAPKYTGLLEDVNSGKPSDAVMRDVAYRVIADHIRTLTFALTDGAIPSNDGRGYVLRRILRRAVRYGRQFFGMEEPFLYKFVPVVADAMGNAFPELKKADGGKNVNRVAELVRDEETSFGKTLDRGIALFEDAAGYAESHHHGRISGEDAFKLHDTYGFPIDLTELMAVERGMTVNIGEYERLMEEARERARAGGSNVEAVAELLNIPKDHLESKTDDSPKYQSGPIEARYTYATGLADDWTQRGLIGMVFDRTCFYAEQGGQVGDHGTIVFENRPPLVVKDVKKVGNQVVHLVDTSSFRPSDRVDLGEAAMLQVDSSLRQPTMSNHTATHILNWALRETLGDHVQQKGSLVDPDKTRFDLSHNAAITPDELTRIETLVNEQIEEDMPVYTEPEADQKEARNINTLRAVFGEKYPDKVRVVSIGVPYKEMVQDPTNNEWMKYSVEFCGGTHVQRTGEIQRFRLVEESAVAKGVRRVTGITGDKAREAEQTAGRLAKELDVTLTGVRNDTLEPAALDAAFNTLSAQVNETELPVVEKLRLRERLAELQEHVKASKKAQAKATAADIMGRLDDVLAGAEKIGGVIVCCADLGPAPVEQMRSAADSLRDRARTAAILLAGTNEDRVVLLAAMTKDVVGKGVKAGDLIREVAPIVGGKGGGRPDMAQGGGTDASKIDEALAAAKTWIGSRLG